MMEESTLYLGQSHSRMANLHHYADEFESLYEPLYLQRNRRGFHDLQQAQLEEALALLEDNIPFGVQNWEFSNSDGWLFRFKTLWLRLSPCVDSPVFLQSEVICVASSLSATHFDPLRDELEALIRDSMEEVDKYLDLMLLILRVTELASYYYSISTNHTLFVSTVKWSNSESKSSQMLKWNRVGVNPRSIEDTSSEYLGMTPLEICRSIPDEYRILEMKSIRTEELTEKFDTYREKMISRLRFETCEDLRRKLHPLHDLQRRNLATVGRDEIIREMRRPHVTFHGTTQYSVSPIAKYGFKKPGEQVDDMTIASPRSGAIIRRGIYSSQGAWYAMSFAECHSDQPVPIDELPGMRLLVCATLPGRTFFPDPKSPDYWDLLQVAHGPKLKNFDSHFDGEYEYISHNSHAILPCYVISLDFGADALREVRKIQGQWGPSRMLRLRSESPSEDSVAMSLSERKDKVREDRAVVSKLLPLGFGAAQGSTLHVTDIVARDDDEDFRPVETYHKLKQEYEWESEQLFDFWSNVLAGRGCRWTHEPENAIPMNLEQLLFLGSEC